MNFGWCFEWIAYMKEVQNLHEMYVSIMDPSFFDPEEPSPDRAALWIARDEFLNVQLDLVRELLWHNMGDRYNDNTNL